MEINLNSKSLEEFTKLTPGRDRQGTLGNKPIGTMETRKKIALVVAVVFALVYYYLVLPPINYKSLPLYYFVLATLGIYALTIIVLSAFNGGGFKAYFDFIKKECKIPLAIAITLLVIIAIGTVISAPVFRASDYKELLTVEEGDFTKEIEEITYDQIPMVDEASAKKLGSRKLGELADMVSQFELASDYTQINYQGTPVRVTSLQYSDIFKWFNNRKDGLPAYLIIDMVTQNVEVVRLENGIKYSTSEHFGRNLTRYLRFKYPTYIFDTPAFEIDESGNPYWVCPRIDKTIGLFGGTDIVGTVLVNAVTGEVQYYDVADVPSWVDHVYTASLIIEQYDYYGKYVNGFINSYFGQKDVTVTTEGYNYMAIDGDVYMYTGITSVVADDSNIGFILCNQRTKETKFYSIAGAEEYSAMESAEGQVQQMSYDATFPLLLNIAGQPTYFMALKDSADLVKMYAMVNVSQYQIVATGSTVAECETNYRKLLVNNNLIKKDEISINSSIDNLVTVSGIVAEIRTAVIDGNTYFYIKLDNSDKYYVISASDNNKVVILDVGDETSIEYVDEDSEICDIYNLSF